MRKLADISAFEQLQNGANAGFVSDMSVFNGEMPQLADIDTFVSVMNGSRSCVENRGPLVKAPSGRRYKSRNYGLRDTSHLRGITDAQRQDVFVHDETRKIAREAVDEYQRNNNYRSDDGMVAFLKKEVPGQIASCIADALAETVASVEEAESPEVMERINRLADVAWSDLCMTGWGQRRNSFGVGAKDPYGSIDVKMPYDSFVSIVTGRASDELTHSVKNKPQSKDKQMMSKYGSWSVRHNFLGGSRQAR